MAGGAIWLGLRSRLAETTYAASLLFVILLLESFFDWWWDLLPKYVFFLLVGAVAIGFLLRAAGAPRPPAAGRPVIRRGHVVAIVLVLAVQRGRADRGRADRREPPHAVLWLTERELPVLAPEKESSLLVELRWAAAARREALFDDRAARPGIRLHRARVERQGGAHSGRRPAGPRGVGGARVRGGSLGAVTGRALSGAGIGAREPAVPRRRRPGPRRAAPASPGWRARASSCRSTSEPLIRTDEKSGTRRLGVLVLWEPARRVMVPASLRSAMDTFAEAKPRRQDDERERPAAPRYRARLRLGSRDLPRLEAVEPEPAR